VPIDILLVEDHQGEIRVMREVSDEINPTARLHVVSDGAAAMDFLLYRERYLHAPRPGVILLDLNPPKRHGREVQARVKANSRLQMIRVIVLTRSEEESDVAAVTN
jgi:two-component system, chemotaxis family, response regulator Rcp1